MYKLELKLDLPLILMSFPLGLMLMLFAVGGYEFYQELSGIKLGSQEMSKETEQVFKVDLQASMALNNMENRIEGLGIDNADMYVIKVEKRKKGLSSLFSKLKKQNNKDVFKVVKSSGVSSQNKSLPNYNAFLSQKEKLAMNEKMIKDLISSKRHLFKGCYNRLLIKDGLLSGIATITIFSQGRGKSVFKGVGRTKVVNELKSCLNTQVTKIDLSNIKMNKAIRFSLNFSS